MPDIQLPPFPPALISGIDHVGVRFNRDLTAKEFTQIIKGTKAKEPGGRHVYLRKGASKGRHSWELSGILGIHPASVPTRRTRATSDRSPWLHYELFARSRPIPLKAEYEQDNGWDAALSELGSLLGAVPVKVDVRLRVPAEGASPAVKLPIPLGRGEVAGFSEIGGVQLALRDESEGGQVVYSVVLQHMPESLGIVVLSDEEMPIDREQLVKAWDRGLALARLAVPSMEEKGV
jgi:hypothetical protein